MAELKYDKQLHILKYLTSSVLNLEFLGSLVQEHNLITDEVLLEMFKIVKKEYDHTKQLMTMEELEMVAKDMFYAPSDIIILHKLFQKLGNLETTETSGNFIKKAVAELKVEELAGVTQDYLNNSKKDTQRLLQKSQKSLNDLNYLFNISSASWVNPFADAEIDNTFDYYKKNPGSALSTGIQRLDSFITGFGGCGIHNGDLNLIIGTTGGGKSTLALNTAVNAVLNHGKFILYYVLDNQIIEMKERLFAHITTDEINEHADIEAFRSKVRKQKNIFEQNGGLFLFKYLSPNKYNLAQVNADIQCAERYYNRTLDLVVFDPGDYIKPFNHYNEKRFGLSEVFAGFRDIASNPECERRVLVTTQSNRGGLDVDNIGLSNMSEDYSKAHPCHLVVTLNQNEDEVRIGKGRIIIAKNRRGKKNMVIPVLINYATQTITDDFSQQATFLSSRRKSQVAAQPMTLKPIQPHFT